MDPTGLNHLVRVLVLVQGKQPIVRRFAVSGVDMAVDTAADPATLDPVRP